MLVKDTTAARQPTTVVRRELRSLDVYELVVEPAGIRQMRAGPIRRVVGESLQMITVTARSMYSVKPLDDSVLQTLSATRMTMAELATRARTRDGPARL